jgi:hypothetical protein
LRAQRTWFFAALGVSLLTVKPSPIRKAVFYKMRLSFKQLILAIGVSAAMFFSAATAYGAMVTYYTVKPMFVGPSQYSQFVAGMNPGTQVQMICWTDSTWYAGTNRWFRVSGPAWSNFWRRYIWVQGYMSANHITQQNRVGHC